MGGGWLTAVLNLLGMGGGGAAPAPTPGRAECLAGRDRGVTTLIGRDRSVTTLTANMDC